MEPKGTLFRNSQFFLEAGGRKKKDEVLSRKHELNCSALNVFAFKRI